MGAGNVVVYIIRIQNHIRLDAMARETKEDGFTPLGSPAPSFQEIVAAARKLASDRAGAPSTPSSKDLLFCACSQDPELSKALQGSGLQLEKLPTAVKKNPL